MSDTERTTDTEPEASRVEHGGRDDALSSTRRQVLGAVTTVAVGGLAGCSSDGDDDGDGDNDDDTTGDGTDASGDAASGTDGTGAGGGALDGTARSEVEGIEVTGVEATVGGTFSILVDLENVGGEDTSVTDFEYEVTLEDASGEDLPVRSVSKTNRDGFYGDTTGQIELLPGFTADDARVAAYEVRVTCGEGPYCEG